MQIFNKVGVITRDDDKTNIVHVFNVPENTKKICVNYSYNPKLVQPKEEADTLLKAAMIKYGVGDLDKEEFEPVKNLVTLSFDECGKYRGACHRQPNEQVVEIKETNSTPGIINRKIEPGTWNVVLNVHYAGCNIDYSLSIEAEVE